MAFAEYKASGEHARILRKRAGAYIKGLRSDARMTQSDLAKKLGLEYYTFISQVENGVTRVPPESVSDWASALKVDEKEFAKKLLSYYDPHTYRAIFGAKGAHD